MTTPVLETQVQPDPATVPGSDRQMHTRLQDVYARIWQELGRAVHDRHHEWRTPVLASVSPDGLPEARTVVLRAVDARQETLQIWTDARTPKVMALQQRPAAMLVFWSRRLSWQLRVAAQARVVTDEEALQAIWARIAQGPAARDYLAMRAPGTVLESVGALEPGKAPLQDLVGKTVEGAVGQDQDMASETPMTRHHLCVLDFRLDSIDWLALGGRQSGHQRALFQAGAMHWLEP